MNNRERTELLRLNNVSASNQKSTILKNIDFNVCAGEIHAIVSTSEFFLQKFLDALAGRITITDGTFWYQGKITSPRELVKGRVNFICQEVQLFSGFTAINNICIKDRGFYRLNARKKRKLAAQCAQEFGLDIDLNTDVGLLSAEERKIVELLRAWQMDVQVVVMHDTFNLVNAEYISSVKSIMRNILQQNKGIVYATTDVEDALNFSTRISILDDGRIKGVFNTKQAIDSPREIMSLISGWEKINEEATEESGINLKMYDALVRSREIMTSSFEIKHVIHSMAVDFCQALSADGCIIYLVDEETSSIIDSVYPDEMQEAPRLTSVFIQSCAQNVEGILISDRDPKYDTHFIDGRKQAQTLLCANVFSENKQIGFIQIWHHRRDAFNATRFRYVTHFAREVGVAIETSKLMGSSVLLQESHHRIKNNLQIVINLVYMQKAKLLQSSDQKADAAEILNAVVDRIKSIALVHDMFSANKLGQGTINLRIMTQKLLNMYAMNDIHYQTEVDNLGIPYSKATSIALVINELLSNCIKHAFPEERDNKQISLFCKLEQGKIILRVIDNGIGLPEDFELSQNNSLGISIIMSIIESMAGSLSYQDIGGTCAEVQIPIGKLYN